MNDRFWTTAIMIGRAYCGASGSGERLDHGPPDRGHPRGDFEEDEKRRKDLDPYFGMGYPFG